MLGDLQKLLESSSSLTQSIINSVERRPNFVNAIEGTS